MNILSPEFGFVERILPDNTFAKNGDSIFRITDTEGKESILKLQAALKILDNSISTISTISDDSAPSLSERNAISESSFEVAVNSRKAIEELYNLYYSAGTCTLIELLQHKYLHAGAISAREREISNNQQLKNSLTQSEELLAMLSNYTKKLIAFEESKIERRTFKATFDYIFKYTIANGAYVKKGALLGYIETNSKFENQIYSPESGYLNKIHIKDGQKITAGTLIAEIDKSEDHLFIDLLKIASQQVKFATSNLEGELLNQKNKYLQAKLQALKSHTSFRDDAYRFAKLGSDVGIRLSADVHTAKEWQQRSISDEYNAIFEEKVFNEIIKGASKNLQLYNNLLKSKQQISNDRTSRKDIYSPENCTISPAITEGSYVNKGDVLATYAAAP